MLTPAETNRRIAEWREPMPGRDGLHDGERSPLGVWVWRVYPREAVWEPGLDYTESRDACAEFEEKLRKDDDWFTTYYCYLLDILIHVDVDYNCLAPWQAQLLMIATAAQRCEALLGVIGEQGT